VKQDIFTTFIPTTAQQFHTKIYKIIQQTSYMFRPFLAIITGCIVFEYLPDDGRKRSKHVDGLQYELYFVPNYFAVITPLEL
jgi:hypothetical protein